VARWFRWSLSVADPFVCRCLSCSAMLPFPHPAHRTRFSDRILVFRVSVRCLLVVVNDHARFATHDAARLRAAPLNPYIVISGAETIFEREYEANGEMFVL